MSDPETRHSGTVTLALAAGADKLVWTGGLQLPGAGVSGAMVLVTIKNTGAQPIQSVTASLGITATDVAPCNGLDDLLNTLARVPVAPGATLSIWLDYTGASYLFVVLHSNAGTTVEVSWNSGLPSTLGGGCAVDGHTSTGTPGPTGASGAGFTYAFSGTEAPGAGAAVAYMANPGRTGAMQAAAQKFPVPSDTTAYAVKVNVSANTLDTDAIVELYKNGVALGPTVTIPHGATGTFSLAGGGVYAAGDLFDLAVVTNETAGGHTLVAAATVKLT